MVDETPKERLLREVREVAARARATPEKSPRPRRTASIFVEGTGNTVAGRDLIQISPIIMSDRQLQDLRQWVFSKEVRE